jgi:predicted  nucleic acid-binding Zn-ribbon protein
MENQNARIYGIIIALLLLLAAGLGWFLFQKSKAATVESQLRQAEIAALLKEKSTLQISLDSLSLSYSDLRVEYENLQGKLFASANTVADREKTIARIKNESSKDAEALRQQIADLQRAKIELETIINGLRAENDQLKNENTRLTGENSKLLTDKNALSGQVADLAKQLEEQIRRTQSASFKASSFRVELERKNDKLTAKARRAREVTVSFDLADVPQPYHGPNKLYLVITDDKGNPIQTANPLKATVQAPTGPVDIIAQQSKSVNLTDTQRYSFTYPFDERLKAGNYVIAIYCDKGLLGASSFRLS